MLPSVIGGAARGSHSRLRILLDAISGEDVFKP